MPVVTRAGSRTAHFEATICFCIHESSVVMFPCHRGSNSSVHLLAPGTRNFDKHMNRSKPVENCYLSLFCITLMPNGLVLDVLECAKSSSFVSDCPYVNLVQW